MINKDFILAEFVFESPEIWSVGYSTLKQLEKEGKLNILEPWGSADEPGRWPLLLSVKIDPLFATILKLTSALLAERMRISYISDELKDKYRK